MEITSLACFGHLLIKLLICGGMNGHVGAEVQVFEGVLFMVWIWF